ncbi:hypothetical protein [Ureibacillus endophyticus]|uniref:Uncharacterized protein n=1 Tax=Ureibacillus endophyticus TaxID=1978490 RepID=A0A494Z2B5_9BACL|nr:hypothetical protein [Lysinibacillus endophyticus]RKQ16442.1 hypothetical protein D8M03_09645 [Lysinibacillus endophyticus]
MKRKMGKFHYHQFKISCLQIAVYACEVLCVARKPEFIFLSKQDGDALVKGLWMKVENGESLSNADMRKLFLLPLTKT